MKLKAFRTHCSKAQRRDADSHKQQFPDMHDPEIANRRLRDRQRERASNTPPSADKSPVMRDRDQRKELQRQYSKAQLEFATNLYGQYPGRPKPGTANSSGEFPSLDDWIARNSR